MPAEKETMRQVRQYCAMYRLHFGFNDEDLQILSPFVADMYLPQTLNEQCYQDDEFKHFYCGHGNAKPLALIWYERRDQ